jgi:hypothetical protein
VQINRRGHLLVRLLGKVRLDFAEVWRDSGETLPSSAN